MFSISQNIQSIVDRDGGVILDFEHDAMITLNSTGAYVWERLRQGKPVGDIICELATETGTAPMAVDHDVHCFINQLKSQHLLSV